MKTKTYARLSLLIPLLVWVLALVPLLLSAATLTISDKIPDQIDSAITIAGGLIAFYVIGILFWFVPYVLLAGILLLISFKCDIKLIKYIYFFSPFAMATMILVEMTVIMLIPYGGTPYFPDPVSNLAISVGIGGVFAIFTLICGYICVGLGLGLYLLLKFFQLIKEEEKPNLTPLVVNSLQGHKTFMELEENSTP
jgi:hypothetical protein